MSVLHDWITLIICRNKKKNKCDVVSSSLLLLLPLLLLLLLLLFYNNQLFHNWMDICVVRCAFIWFFDRIIMVIFLCKKFIQFLTFCIVNLCNVSLDLLSILATRITFCENRKKKQITMNHLTLCCCNTRLFCLSISFFFHFISHSEWSVGVCV